MKIAFKTLGCRVNLYETDAIASQFKEAGYDVVESDENADVYVVNTCTVTNQSDRNVDRQSTKSGAPTLPPSSRLWAAW